MFRMKAHELETTLGPSSSGILQNNMNSLVAYESSGSETDNDECGADGCLGREGDLIVKPESRFQRVAPKAGRSKSTSDWAMGNSSPGDLSAGHTAPNKRNVPRINVQTAPKSPDTTMTHQAHPQQGPPIFSKRGLPNLLSRAQKCNKLPAKVISCVRKRSSFQDSVGAPGNIRPYVPKRVRREQAVSYTNSATVDHTEALTSEQKYTASEDQPSNATSRVSDFIQPYLEKHSKTSEIPKRCLFQMGEHSGPVNKIQWCPVQQHSHLLLSASMDKSLKVWDAIDTSKCLKTYLCHRGAVRDAQWSLCGRQILSGGFDSMLHLTDIETGKQIVSLHNGCRITCLAFNPVHQSSFLTGGFSSTIKAWDTRNCKVVNEYSAGIQQTLDILFLPGGKEFVTSTDVASRDSADRTVIAWDFQTSAKISNQIFHERYTIPCMAVHPKEAVFVAQTNGSYMVLFSTQRPYRMNKRKRYEGHKVEGYAVGCEFSPDGTLIATGSADGTVYFYNYLNSKLIRTLPAHREACVDVSFHPVHPSIIATCDWSGEIKVWH